MVRWPLQPARKLPPEDPYASIPEMNIPEPADFSVRAAPAFPLESIPEMTIPEDTQDPLATIPEISNPEMAAQAPDVSRDIFNPPPPPELQGYPDTAPKGLKGALKRSLLYLIPGYARGYEGEVNRQREDIDVQNKQAVDVWRTLTGQAGTEARYANEALKLDQARQKELHGYQINQVKNQIAQQRANDYAKSIESLTQYRANEGLIHLDNLDRQWQRDADLDLNTKERLRIASESVRGNLALRAQEEQGRNERMAAIEQGRNQRAQVWREKGMTERDIALSLYRAESAIKLLGDKAPKSPEDYAELVNELMDSFMSGEIPQFGTKPKSGLSGIFGGTQITPGTPKPMPARTRPGQAPAPTPAAAPTGQNYQIIDEQSLKMMAKAGDKNAYMELKRRGK
jgi:hypothetical protein